MMARGPPTALFFLMPDRLSLDRKGRRGTRPRLGLFRDQIPPSLPPSLVPQTCFCGRQEAFWLRHKGVLVRYPITECFGSLYLAHRSNIPRAFTSQEPMKSNRKSHFLSLFWFSFFLSSKSEKKKSTGSPPPPKKKTVRWRIAKLPGIPIFLSTLRRRCFCSLSKNRKLAASPFLVGWETGCWWWWSVVLQRYTPHLDSFPR